MKKLNRTIRVVPNKTEIVSMTSDGVLSALSNLSGISDPLQYLLATGFGFAATRINRWAEPILEFIKSSQSKKGKDAEKAYSKFFETLKFLAYEQPADDGLMEALKNLHILSLHTDIKIGEETEIYMLLDTTRRLRGEHILTILTAYKIAHNSYSKENMERIHKDLESPVRHASAWCEIITRACGYTNSDYITRQQSLLEDMQLISSREPSLKGSYKENTFLPTTCFRLTKSGEKLAEFIVRGEKIIKS